MMAMAENTPPNGIQIDAGIVHAKAVGFYTVIPLLALGICGVMLYGVTVITSEIKAGNQQLTGFLGELRTEQHNLFMATMLNDQQKAVVQAEIAADVRAKIKSQLLEKTKEEIEHAKHK